MRGKAIRLAAVAAAALWIGLATAGARSVARAQDADSADISPDKTAPKIPDLAGNWTGTEENTTTGETHTLSVVIDQNKGNLHGTWDIVSGDNYDFTGTVNAKDAMTITTLPRPKHPSCKINATGVVSDDATQIAGSFKFSKGCGNDSGQTGTFQITS